MIPTRWAERAIGIGSVNTFGWRVTDRFCKGTVVPENRVELDQEEIDALRALGYVVP